MRGILLIFLFLNLSLIHASNEKTLKLLKTDFKIEIDGIIDPAWQSADSVTDFFQQDPFYGQEPSKRTVAKILTTDNSLFCLIISYDDPNNIQATKGTLDDFAGDAVSLMLDTFGDGRTGYKFAVSASGVRSDSRLLDDARNRDYNWDGIWFADAKIYDYGYVVEMEIPYKSIQYDETLTEWGLDFDRWIPHLNEDIYWCEYEQSEGQRVSKFGKLLFTDLIPESKGLNLEIYPVAITKVQYLQSGNYKFEPNAGIDVFYNPSPQLTYQLTANPDFAQIEADPYDFNISRYESYFDERRPFFVNGNEIFMPSGRQRNTGFYRPVELFYSRRIGKKLTDGSEVPLIFGTKAFGRLGSWEYGGFMALTGEKDYFDDDTLLTEQRAYFGAVRLKKQFFKNSSIGLLAVGKHTADNNYGVIDIDGAFRQSQWQLSYQLARSFKNSDGDYAASAGLTSFGDDMIILVRGRFIGKDFDVDEIGFVPWRGTANITGLAGPVWFFDSGYIKQILIYGGGSLYYEDADLFTDHSAALGFNMQLRDNWGYEINLSAGKSRDSDVEYSSYDISLSSWFNVSPNWNGNLWGGYSKTYNFSREYLAFYSWVGTSFNWKALDILDIGTSYNMWIEGNPAGNIEDITFNARPYFSFTPFNDMNLRLYVDNVFVRSSDKLEQLIVGFLFAYNFSPKSWIYFAVNELKDRRDRYDEGGNLLPAKLRLADRAGVFKVSYLYYF